MKSKQASEAQSVAQWLQYLDQVERCDEVIQQYADLGISGDANDHEHRLMRDKWVDLANSVRPKGTRLKIPGMR